MLRKLKLEDISCFAKWWRDEELIKRTSGILTPISDEQVQEYLAGMLISKTDHHFMITVDDKPIGHVVLAQRYGDWYETQIVIGEKNFWGHGYATSAMKELLEKAKSMGIRKVFLEVRPDNLGAISVYEKCGFIKKGTIDYPDNPNLPQTLRMELE